MFKKIVLFLSIIAVVCFAFKESIKLLGKNIIFPAWSTPGWDNPEQNTEFPLSFYGCNPVIDIILGDKPFPVVLDTGATSTALDYDVVASIADVWPIIPGLLSIATIPSLRVGNTQFKNVRCLNPVPIHGLKAQLDSSEAIFLVTWLLDLISSKILLNF